MKTIQLRCIDIPLGPGQPTIRLAADDQTLTITLGHDDPWRPGPRLELPATSIDRLTNGLQRIHEPPAKATSL